MNSSKLSSVCVCMRASTCVHACVCVIKKFNDCLQYGGIIYYTKSVCVCVCVTMCVTVCVLCACIHAHVL